MDSTITKDGDLMERNNNENTSQKLRTFIKTKLTLNFSSFNIQKIINR